MVKDWAQKLPQYFDSHLLTQKDEAIQAFNANDYKRAYHFTFKAIFKGALFDTKFIKDIMYHTKRKFFRKD